MTSNSTFTALITLGGTLALGLSAATGCGSDTGSGTTDNDGVNDSGAAGSGGGSGTAGSGTAGTGATSGTGGTGSSGGSSGSAGAGGESTCEAGSGVQGGGADTCPRLAWRCVDETIGNPPFRLVGAECSTGHTGGCCNYSDKCLTNTDGTPSSQSAVEVAIGPCQAGCIANPSAQACLDCINGNLTSAGLAALSSGCGTCWANLINCSFTNCLGQCAAGAIAPGCRECVFENCVVGAGRFNACSGVLSNAGL